MVQGFITNWGSFVLLQIGTSVITNWGSLVITKWGRRYYKLGQLLQIRATVITNWGSYYKLGQTLLQINAAITNWGIYYKLGHNTNNYHDIFWVDDTQLQFLQMCLFSILLEM